MLFGAKRPVAKLLIDGPAEGAWNMAVDEVLLEGLGEKSPPKPTLRLYRWKPATLSLGYFQRYADRQTHPPSLTCPVVRRPSGGGAIVHDIELTYCLAIPAANRWVQHREQLYFLVHEAVARVLRELGWRAEVLGKGAAGSPGCSGSGQDQSSDQRALTEDPAAGLMRLSCDSSPNRRPFLCFQRRYCGDVVVGSWKVLGSAQRQTRAGLLQHGSLLLARSPAAPELPGLAELWGKPLVEEHLLQALLEALAGSLDLTWEPAELTAAQQAAAQQLREQKYGNLDWIARL